jgi:ferric-dicitrate binding protein FerR (iron transport regulator)
MNTSYYLELTDRLCHTGELTRRELTELFEWLNSAEGRMAYDYHLQEQQISLERQSMHYPHLSAGRMLRRIRQKAGVVAIRSIRTEVMKYTAVMLIVVLSSSLAWIIISSQLEKQNSNVVFTMDKGNKGQMTLADGSKMWLNSGSRITYNAMIQRNIVLDGEVYLNVVKNPKRPFTVKTGYGDVKVYGTQFEVTAYTRDSIINVALMQGSVSLNIPGHENVYLQPGQEVRYYVRTDELVFTEHNVKEAALWRKDELRIVNAPTETLYQKMSSWYSIDIELINKPVKEPLYNMTIRHESIEEMMELIRKVTPIKYEINGKEVKIKYESR